jgi:hypothetical protein
MTTPDYNNEKVRFWTSIASPLVVALILWFFNGTSKVEDNQRELLMNQKLIQRDIIYIQEKLDYNTKWIKQSDDMLTDHERRIIKLESKQKQIEKDLYKTP